MSGGFNNTIVGGADKLIRTSIQSTDYIPGVTGWSINKDGTAEFTSITIPPGLFTSVAITFAAISPAAPNAGDLWYDTNNGNLAHQWDGANWLPYTLGTAAIANGSITAGLIAANTITAGELATGIVYAGIVNGTEIDSTTLLLYDGAPGLGTLFYANSPTGGTDSHGNVYPQGQTFIAVPNLVSAFTVEDQSTPANTLASIDTDGNISGAILSANVDMVIGGQSLTNDILPQYALGIVNLGYTNSYGTSFPGGGIKVAEQALMELDQELTAGRLYRIKVPSTSWYTGVAGLGRLYMYLRYTTNGTTPTTSSALLHSNVTNMPVSSTTIEQQTPELDKLIAPGVSANYKFLLTAICSTGTAYIYNTLNFYIEDVGPSSAQNSTQNATILGTGGTGGGASTQTYTKYYYVTGTHSYQGSDGHQPNTTINTNGNCYQGGDYANTYNGTSKSLMMLPYATIVSNLSGATINWIRVSFKNSHSWYGSGMLVNMGYQNFTSFGSTYFDPSGVGVGLDYWHTNTGQWLTHQLSYADAQTFGLALQGGTAKNLLLYVNSNNLTYYGYFQGGANNAYIIVNYTK